LEYTDVSEVLTDSIIRAIYMAISQKALSFRMINIKAEKVKQSHNTPLEAQGGEEVWLLFHDLGTRWG
jgi:hypothetical protein